MDSKHEHGFSTAALHTTLDKDAYDASVSIVPPIMTAATYLIPEDYELASQTRMMYQRYGNTTRNALEATLAKLEGAKAAATFSSGMAAINALVEAVLKQGDHILASKKVYGGTYNLFSKDLCHVGISCTLVTASNPESIVKKLTPKTKLVWLEVCSNPTTEIMDLKKTCDAIRGYNKDIIIGVDNTFLSPFILKPLSLGADVVMHSCSKYLSGHSDLIVGSLAANREDLIKAFRTVQVQRGATPSPFDCYLLQRSLYTLEVRMLRHHENSVALAKFLEKHPAVERILHPMLESHPDHKLAKEQHRGLHSGMIGMYLKKGSGDGKQEVMAFLKELQLISCAVSLGGVQTLACYPTNLSHSYLSESDRLELGITRNFVRISVGLENVEDLIRDIDQALVKATGLKTLAI